MDSTTISRSARRSAPRKRTRVVEATRDKPSQGSPTTLRGERGFRAGGRDHSEGKDMTTTWDYLLSRDPDLERARDAMFKPPHIGVPELKDIAYRRHERQEAQGHQTAAEKIEGYYGPDPAPSRSHRSSFRYSKALSENMGAPY